jgi:hypothetical protein
MAFALIMRRGLVDNFITVFKAEAIHAFMELLAGFLQKQYLVLLLGDYFIQILQQIFLIGCFNLQFDQSLLAHGWKSPVGM